MKDDESTELDVEPEETEESAPPCPFCGVFDDECEHQLAIIDRSFLDFYGGLLWGKWEEIQELIEAALRERRAANRPFKPSRFEYLNSLIEMAWASMEADVDKPAGEVVDPELDQHVFFDFLIEILNSTAGVKPDTSYEDGAPGYSSVVDSFWSENPTAAFEEMMRVLKDELAKE